MNGANTHSTISLLNVCLLSSWVQFSFKLLFISVGQGSTVDIVIINFHIKKYDCVRTIFWNTEDIPKTDYHQNIIFLPCFLALDISVTVYRLCLNCKKIFILLGQHMASGILVLSFKNCNLICGSPFKSRCNSWCVLSQQTLSFILRNVHARVWQIIDCLWLVKKIIMMLCKFVLKVIALYPRFFFLIII